MNKGNDMRKIIENNKDLDNGGGGINWVIVQPNKDLDNGRRDKKKLIENNKDLDNGRRDMYEEID